jgi:cardiolipin synthase A/B
MRLSSSQSGVDYPRGFEAPLRSGNGFQLLLDGRDFFARMLTAIDESQHYVLAEFYLVESGQIAQRFIAALAGAVSRGVQVRALFDAIGARGFSEADRARLRTAGVDLVFFNVPRWRALSRILVRDHRKLLIVDGNTGFTGGIGIADMFSPEALPDSYWLDCIAEITGPVLADWHALFARTWKRSAGRELDVLPRAGQSATPGELGRVAVGAGLGTQELGRSILKRVRKSRARIWIATAYFWPSTRLRRALRRAARRGVDVRLLVPGPLTDAPAARSVARLFYARLLFNGVVIYEYQPRFLHTKLVLCDDWVSLGSSNLDRWGLLWNLEANQEIDSPAFAAQVEQMLTQAFEQSVMLREPGEVQHHWSVPFWKLLTTAILAWSTRAVARLRR